MALRFKTWLFAAAFLAAPAAASATGGIGCVIDDDNLSLTFEAIYSYSDIGGLHQVRGDFLSKDKRTYEMVKSFPLEAADLKQQWFRGDDLKLMLYRESAGNQVPFASVKLIIEATKPPGDEFEYTGTYALTIIPAGDGQSEPEDITLKGRINCSAG
ncbi:hypothetical protein [Rhizobium sp.]